MKDKLMPKQLSRFCLAVLMLAALVASGNLAAETDSTSIRILVYGATGKVGSQAVNEALNRGHIVTAVSRDPSRITVTHDNLTAVKGDVLDPDSVASLVAGQDVVIISVRGVLGKSKDPNDAVPRIAVENVVNVLREIEKPAPRFIHVGGSGSLVVKPGVVYADTLPMIFVPRALQTEIEGQVLALEYLRSVSDVDWTYATPAKNFTNGKRTGVFRIGGDQLLESKSGRSRISRADFAVALIDEVENAAFIQQRFSVVY
ncbi:MAG: NAD(P)H-binding protein [Lysobacterales bacterium]